MKRIILVLLLLYTAQVVHSQFDLRLATPYSYFMEDVFYADSNTALITGGNYYGTTLDGGQNWHGLGSSGMSVKAAFYSSNRFGIVVGDGGKFRINTECAYFWGWGNISYIGVNKDLKDVFFINEQKGIVCGVDGTLMLTNNQTLSWTSIENPSLNDLHGLHMLNDSIAFACGDGGEVIKLLNDTIYTSDIIDAGINFTKIYFVNENKGFVIGSAGIVYKTEDQGTSWNLIDIGLTEDLLNIDFSNENHGSICGDNGLIYTTFDGGDTWSEAAVIPEEEIRALTYSDEQSGLAVGSNFLLSTDDGGLTWVRISGDLRSIDFPTEERGYAVGFWGTAFRSKDGGNNWEAMNLNTTQYLNDVYFLNADTGFVVGGHEMYRTLDGGDTWNSLPIDVEGSLYGVYFSDYNHGVAVGYRRGILHTDDGGETWDYEYSWGSEVWYHGVQFTSQDTGYFCSSSGVVYKSVDGGESWEVQSTGDNISLANTHFLDNDVGWAVGSQGKIVKTTNGGEDWISQESGVDTYLGGIDFFNPDTGIVTGSDGTYIVTYDGGESWLDYSSGYADWSDLAISPSGIPFAVAGMRISSIAPFNAVSMTYARCGGDRIYYNTFTPYFNNDETHSVVVEMTTIDDDYSNAIPLLYLEVDSTALVDAYLPENLPEGVYKYRLRDVNDSSFKSFDRHFKMTTTPQINISIVDSIAYATSSEEVQVAWYYRESPDQSGYWIGNGDSIQVPGTGELFIYGNSECCDASIDWTMVGECNGELLWQDEFAIETDYTICAGDSIFIAGSYYSEEGSYRDSLLNSNGCDSVLISNIMVLLSDSISLNEQICSNESYQVGNTIYNESGNYSDTLLNQFGCDSIVYLDLWVNTAYSVDLDSSICTGDTVFIGANAYTESGFFTDSLISSLGCDSIITLQLNVDFQGDSIQEFTLCDGDSILIEDNYYSVEGNYIDSSMNENGCLVVYYTSIYVLEPIAITLGSDTLICESDVLILSPGTGFENYLWSTEEQGSSIEISQENLYWVEVTDEYGCVGSDSIQVWVEICSGISELSDQWGIQLYPNPSSGQFYINCNAQGITLEIFKVNGENVQTIELSNSQNQISLEQSGVYILRFTSGDDSFQLELIIQ